MYLAYHRTTTDWGLPFVLFGNYLSRLNMKVGFETNIEENLIKNVDQYNKANHQPSHLVRNTVITKLKFCNEISACIRKPEYYFANYKYILINSG